MIIKKTGCGWCNSQATFSDQRYPVGGHCLEGQALSSCTPIVAVWPLLTSQWLTQEELGNFRYFCCVFLPYRRLLFSDYKRCGFFFNFLVSDMSQRDRSEFLSHIPSQTFRGLLLSHVEPRSRGVWGRRAGTFLPSTEFPSSDFLFDVPVGSWKFCKERNRISWNP